MSYVDSRSMHVVPIERPSNDASNLPNTETCQYFDSRCYREIGRRVQNNNSSIQTDLFGQSVFQLMNLRCLLLYVNVTLQDNLIKTQV